MGMGVVNHTSNIDSRLSKLFAYPNACILELAKGVWIIEVGLYIDPIFRGLHGLATVKEAWGLYNHAVNIEFKKSHLWG